MIIYPAIDIRQGNCVRLYQGDYTKETIYRKNPETLVEEFVAMGAKSLHLVDLDGAKDPKANQARLIKKLLRTAELQIQIGGGIRSERQIADYFAAGASKVVLGTVAVQYPDLVAAWLQKYGEDRFVLAFDVIFIKNQAYVMRDGWQECSNLALFAVIQIFLAAKLKHILCTDISKDGALTGPNLALYQALIAEFPSLSIQASGGISKLADILSLKALGVGAAIIGRALYEKQIDLREALSC